MKCPFIHISCCPLFLSFRASRLVITGWVNWKLKMKRKCYVCPSYLPLLNSFRRYQSMRFTVICQGRKPVTLVSVHSLICLFLVSLFNSFVRSFVGSLVRSWLVSLLVLWVGSFIFGCLFVCLIDWFFRWLLVCLFNWLVLSLVVCLFV